MGIGTSLGAYFEDDFDHQAGNEYTPPEIKPKNETSDSNVKTPNEAQTDKQLNDIEMQELGGIPIRMRIFPQKEQPIETADRQSDAANKSFKGGYLGDKALSEKDNDQDNFWFKDDWQNTWDSAVGKSIWKDDAKGFIEKQGPDVEGFTTPGSEMLWLRRRSPPQDSQSVPMSSNDPVYPTPDYMNPPDREPVQVAERPPAQVLFKTKTGVTITDHDIEDGTHVAMSSGTGTIGSLKGKWFARGPAAEMPPGEAARLQRQPSNIEPDQVPEPYQPTPRQAHEDDTDYALRVIGEVLDHPSGREPVVLQAEGQRIQDSFRQEPFRESDFPLSIRNLSGTTSRPSYSPEEISAIRQERIDSGQRKIREVREQFEKNPDKVKTKGPVSMMRDMDAPKHKHYFNFMSKDGVPGELNVVLKNQGKEIRVSGIYGIGGFDAHSMGTSEIKNLFKLLAEEFPTAEYVTGFRVSGARAHSGSGADEVQMRIPGRNPKPEEPKSPERQIIDRDRVDWNEPLGFRDTSTP